mgnify:CR=1 FL=1
MRMLYRFDYALRDAAGTVVDASDVGAPLAFIEGDGKMVPGLEAALVGREAGDSFAVAIPPSEGYGDVQSALIHRLSTAHLDVDPAQVTVGSLLQLGLDGEMRVVKVLEVGADTLLVDGNHPLAGVTLRFDVTVVEARPATNDELALLDA